MPLGGEFFFVFMWQNQIWSKGLGVSAVTKQEVPSEVNKALTLLHTGANVAQLLCQLFHGYHPLQMELLQPSLLSLPA